ncbi:MAG: ATP-dependent DNA helicase RecG [Sinobacterium sp.]|nr:ATP-dependent DNA helicase RecG [Sinobacterium sp.]
MQLSSPLTQLNGVGPKLNEKLNGYGIHNIGELLFHLPRQYQDRTRLSPIALIRPFESALFEGLIISSKVNFGKRRSLIVVIEDDTAVIKIRLFHFSKPQQNALQEGNRIRCFGEVKPGPSGLEIIHPDYQINPDQFSPIDHCLTPVYPSTDGISQALWRKLQSQAIQALDTSDSLNILTLPNSLHYLNVPLYQALQFLHQPPPDADLFAIEEGRHPFQQRLIFEELVAHQLSLLTLRAKRRAFLAPVFSEQRIVTQLLNDLPFKLTGAQQRTLNEVVTDCANNKPMLRLIQGDVGSGKTVVAAAAAALAVQAGFQVAIMAPTEILAEQHLASFTEWFEPLDISCEWLVGRHTKKQKRETLERLQLGLSNILIGTHAIFQDDVIFSKLGLVIIDEQHRFGVHQRLSLKDKGMSDTEAPHQLIMTATPIPRTLAMTAYADLSLSVIDELPPGRKPIKTIAFEQTRREDIIQRIRAVCAKKTQAYWVCTLIEESEHLNCQAAENTEILLRQALPELNIALIHGKLKPQEKADIMQTFSEGKTDLLVATTVIEVGVNVPNATLMVIENPERLGLAQLHQLRGRVGRGDKESFCVLLYKSPLSENAKTRIQIMRETNDGFKIAETDLQLRGPGEVLGTKQTGNLQYRLADIERDEKLISPAQDFAKHILKTNTELAEQLIKRWITHADYYAQG